MEISNLYIEALGLTALNGYVMDVDHAIALCKESYTENYHFNLAVVNRIYRVPNPKFSGNFNYPLNPHHPNVESYDSYQLKTRLMYAIKTNNVPRVQFLLKYCNKIVLNTVVPNRTLYEHFLYNTTIAVRNPPTISHTGLYWLTMMELFSPSINHVALEMVKYPDPITGKLYRINYVMDEEETSETPVKIRSNDKTLPLSPSSSSVTVTTVGTTVNMDDNIEILTNLLNDTELISTDDPLLTIHVPSHTNFSGTYRRMYRDCLDILIERWPKVGIASFGTNNLSPDKNSITGSTRNQNTSTGTLDFPRSRTSVDKSLGTFSVNSSSSSSNSSSTPVNTTLSTNHQTIEYVLMGPPSTPYSGVPFRLCIEYEPSYYGYLCTKIYTLNYMFHPCIKFADGKGILSDSIFAPFAYGETIGEKLNSFLQTCHIFDDSPLITGEEGSVLRNTGNQSSTTTNNTQNTNTTTNTITTTNTTNRPSSNFEIMDAIADMFLQENRNEFAKLVSKSIQKYGKLANLALKNHLEIFLLPYINPLIYSVYHNNMHMVQLLITAGANVEIRTYYGDTPLVLALRQGNIALVTYLLEYGKANPYVRNGRGEDCLIDAQNFEFLEDDALPPKEKEKLIIQRQELVRLLQFYRALKK